MKPNLFDLEPRLTPTSEIEPNDTFATANVISVPVGDVLTGAWGEVNGFVSTSNDRDVFRFQLDGPAGLFANLVSTGPLDGVLELYDVTGQTLFAASNAGYHFRNFAAPLQSSPGTPSKDPAIAADLPAGEYAIRVRSYNGASQGGYKLQLLADPNYISTPPVHVSNPAAAHTIFLDFDGHAATDQFGTYSTTAYGLSGKPDVWTPAERLAVFNIWRVVADDWAPLNVNVTTVAPVAIGPSDFRVVITSSPPANLNRPANATNAVEFASLTSSSANTGFVFAGNFGDYLGGVSGRLVAAPLEIGNTASYVVGRAAGLRHYGGANPQPGGLLHVPDLGLNRETWSAGPTHSGEPPVGTQDDLVHLAALFGSRPDDHGDTPATATLLSGSFPLTAHGVISQPFADHDVFRVTSPSSGVISITATTDPYAGNAELMLAVLNAAGEPLPGGASAIPHGTRFITSIPDAGDYFLQVRGKSGGSYQLKAEYGSLPLPIQVEGVVINGGKTQRSIVTEAVVNFSGTAVLPSKLADAFRLTRTGPGGPVGDVGLVTELKATVPKTIVRLSFTGPLTYAGSLIDGAYSLWVLADMVQDIYGQPLDGSGDFIPGGDHLHPMHRLAGDLDGDRKIGFVDFLAFRSAFGTADGHPNYQPLFDFDEDEVIGFSDFLFFRQRFGMVV